MHSDVSKVRTRIVAVLLAVGLVALGTSINGCTGCNDGPSRQVVKLQLDWKPGAEHAFLYYGRARGFFLEEGIDVDLVPGTGSSAAANMVDARAVEFALCAGESAAQARASDPPRRIRTVAIFYPNTPTVVYSLSAKGIRAPTDLYGKRLGVVKGSSAYRNYQAFASKIGLDRSHITEIPVVGDVREILQDQVDAMVHFAFQHPLLLRLRGRSVSELRIADYGIKIYGQGLITHEDTLEKRGDLVRRFTRAVQKSYRETIRHPDEALAVFLKEFPDQDAAYAKAKLDWVVEFVRSGVPSGKPLGYQDAEGWIATMNYLREQGLLQRDVPVQDVFREGFLDVGQTLP